MNEITQYIQKLEARYEEVKNEKTWYDSCEYRREGRERELEDVISELKEVVAAFKARLNKQADSYPNINADDFMYYVDSHEILKSVTMLKQIVKEI
jgi:hypothetical protein